MKYQYHYQTKIGLITIVEENHFIVGIYFKDCDPSIEQKETKLILKMYTQLNEYFDQLRMQFDIPYRLEGTEFQKQVWNALLNIPYGTIVTYQDIANQIKNPKAVRAVGMANHKNKLPILIPCHRVIGKNKKLVGYAGGLELKQFLLDLEKKEQPNRE